MKSCYIKTNKGVEVRVNNSPSLLFEKLKAHYKNDDVALKQYEKLRNIDYKYKDVNGEPNFILNTGIGQLDNILIALQTSGISISATKDFIEENNLRTGSKITVEGIASLSKNIIHYNKGDVSTLAEEAIHLVTATVKDSKTFQRAMTLIDNTKEFKDYYQTYLKQYNGNEKLARKEILDKILTTKVLNNNTRPSTIPSNLWRAIKYYFNKGLSYFKPSLEPLLNNILQDINKSSYDFTNIQQEDMYKLKAADYKGRDLSKYVKIIEKHIDKKIAKVAKLKKLNQRTGGLQKEIQQTEVDLIINRNDLAIVNQINLARTKIKENIKRLQNLEGARNVSGNQVSKLLIKLNDDFKLYSGLFEDIRLVGVKDKGLKKELKKATNDLKDFELDYKRVRLITLKEFMFPFAKLDTSRYKDKNGEELDQLIKEAELLSLSDRWLQSLADAKDDFLKILDQMVKKAHNLVQQTSIKEINKMFRLWDKVENKNNLDRFFQTVILPDGTKKLGRYLIGDVNTEQFQVNMKETIRVARDKFNISHDYNTRLKQMDGVSPEALEFIKQFNDLGIRRKNQTLTYNDLLNTNDRNIKLANIAAAKLIKEEYNKEVAPWFKENTENDPNAIKKIYDKFNEIIDDVLIADAAKYKANIKKAFKTNVQNEQFGMGTEYIRQTLNEIFPDEDILPSIKRDIISATHSFDAWLSFRSGYKKVNGILELYYKYDLSIPNNRIYGRLSPELNKADQEFLDFIKSIKKVKGNKLSGYQEDDLVPQLNQGTQERIENGDLKGLFQSIHESFIISKDDTDLGQLDENGQQVKQIPVFFNNKLEYDNMSRDLPTVFANYIIMANHHIEMTKAQDTIRLMQEQNTDRITYKMVKGQKKYISGDTNSKRAEDFIDAVVFKQQKLPETWLGKNTIRIMDTLQKYVSLNGLGFNIFSGVANIFTSSATTMQERAVSKWGKGLDKKSWIKARNVYAKHGLGSMTDYENEVSTNKFKILSREMGILDELESKLGSNDAGKSRLGRIIKSLPFLPNSMGEHAIQHYTALAMMANVKLKDSNGKEIDLIDAFFESTINGEIKWNKYTLNDKPFTLQDAKIIGRKINKENQRLFGIYNNIDKSALQKYALGRFVMQFRKFIIPGFNRRFQGREFDFQSGREVEGMYSSYFHFIKGIYESTKGQRHMLLSTTVQEWKRWQKEDPEGFNNLIRSHVEVANVLAAMAFGALLTALVDADDEDEPALAFIAYQMNRHYSEMSFFTNPASFFEITKSPMAAVNQLETIMNFSKTFDAFGYVLEGDPFIREYKDGTGDTYFKRNLIRTAPFGKMVKKILDPQKQFDLTK